MLGGVAPKKLISYNSYMTLLFGVSAFEHCTSDALDRQNGEA